MGDCGQASRQARAGPDAFHKIAPTCACLIVRCHPHLPFAGCHKNYVIKSSSKKPPIHLERAIGVVASGSLWLFKYPTKWGRCVCPASQSPLSLSSHIAFLALLQSLPHSKSRMVNLIYVGLVVAQVCTLAAYVVVTAGAALLQQRANNLPLWEGKDEKTLAATQVVYNDVFQSTTYIIPYPSQPQFQFQYQWWIIQFELFVFVITAAITVFPSLIVRVRPVALTFIASALVLVMDNINALFFLLRNDTAKQVFEEYRIQVAQAGLIMVGGANFLTIFFLGLYQPTEQNTNGDGAVYISKA